MKYKYATRMDYDSSGPNSFAYIVYVYVGAMATTICLIFIVYHTKKEVSLAGGNLVGVYLRKCILRNEKEHIRCS